MLPHHMFYQPACDYNNMPKVNGLSFGLGKGPYTVALNCFMKRDLTEISFDYTKKFFDTYKTKRKMFSMRIIAAHELTGENSRYLDQHLAHFLEEMDSAGHLDNTIVYIYSDHGDHINYVLADSVSGSIEKMNPFFFAMLPSEYLKGKNIEGNILENRHRMVTHFDMFRNDLIVMGKKADEGTEKGASLFFSLVDKGRSCESAKVRDNCKCHAEGSGSGGKVKGKK